MYIYIYPPMQSYQIAPATTLHLCWFPWPDGRIMVNFSISQPLDPVISFSTQELFAHLDQGAKIFDIFVGKTTGSKRFQNQWVPKIWCSEHPRKNSGDISPAKKWTSSGGISNRTSVAFLPCHAWDTLSSSKLEQLPGEGDEKQQNPTKIIPWTAIMMT